MESSLEFRIRRMYTAFESSRETEIPKLRGVHFTSKKVAGFFNDFSNGESSEQLSNHLGSLLSCIMTIQDILQQRKNEYQLTPSEINATFREHSKALSLVRDLRVANEHGWPPNTSWTGDKPQVKNLRRSMELKTSGGSNSCVAMFFGKDGTPNIVGDGQATAVLEADIYSEKGVHIGSLSNVISDAVRDLENFLRKINILQSSD